jgi:uncharacterized membrane protein
VVGLTEIRQYGATSAQVVRRMRAMLDDLTTVAPESRRPALRHQLALLDEAIEAAHPNPAEAAIARIADRHGLGEPASTRREDL